MPNPRHGQAEVERLVGRLARPFTIVFQRHVDRARRTFIGDEQETAGRAQSKNASTNVDHTLEAEGERKQARNVADSQSARVDSNEQRLTENESAKNSKSQRF